MSGMLGSFLLNWLLWGVVIWCAYAGALYGLDRLLAHRQRQQRRQRRRRAHLAELAQIDGQAAAAVRRICAGFALAQKRIRDEAVQGLEVGR